MAVEPLLTALPSALQGPALATWRGLQLSACTGVHHADRDSEFTGKLAAAAGAKVYSIRTHSGERGTDAARQLINESHGVFQSLQAAVSGQTPLDAHGWETYSQQYRSKLQACVLLLTDRAASAGSQEELDALIDQQKQYAYMNSLWHLCEIFFIRSPQGRTGGSVLPDLMEWVSRHDGDEVDNDFGAVVRGQGGQVCHPKFWSTVFSLVFQGRSDEAQRLMSFHGQYVADPGNPYLIMESLLRTMPQLHAGRSPTEFLGPWYKWRQLCESHLDVSFASAPELQELCRVLLGGDDIFDSINIFPTSWVQLLVAKLRYTEPLIKIFDLQYEADWAMRKFAQRTGLQPLGSDMLLKAVMEMDDDQLLRDSCERFDWWFPAHLCDLLTACGAINKPERRETLLLEYGTGLFSHGSLWAVGATYIASCPSMGADCLEILLEQVPLDSDRKAAKVIQLCDRHRLGDLRKTVARVMGRRAADAGRTATAINWYLQAGEVGCVSSLADAMLREYVQTGSFPLEGLDALFGSALLANERLTFIAKYMEFHRSLAIQMFIAAGSILANVLASDMAPRWFVVQLLLDCLPLLEHPEIVFDSEQTRELLHKLEDVHLSHRSIEYFAILSEDEASSQTEARQRDVIEAKLQPLRLALSRNLCRAILAEGRPGVVA